MGVKNTIMRISEIKDKKLRELAELRRDASCWDFSDFLDEAFDWDESPERDSFWIDVYSGLRTSIPKPILKPINISLKDWEEHAPLGCYISGTIISMNGKRCDNIYSGGAVKAALEFVLTELGYEVNIDEI
jgi:hypothetical protein